MFGGGLEEGGRVRGVGARSGDTVVVSSVVNLSLEEQKQGNGVGNRKGRKGGGEK